MTIDMKYSKFNFPNKLPCPSQWARDLKPEMSWSAHTLGSWVRMPLNELMSVCVSSVFVLFCVGSGFATG
jgi:hypothetical protein